MFGLFGIGLHIVLLFQSFATDLIENFDPLIGVKFLVKPGQGDTDHIAMADLSTWSFLKSCSPDPAGLAR